MSRVKFQSRFRIKYEKYQNKYKRKQNINFIKIGNNLLLYNTFEAKDNKNHNLKAKFVVGHLHLDRTWLTGYEAFR